MPLFGLEFRDVINFLETPVLLSLIKCCYVLYTFVVWVLLSYMHLNLVMFALFPDSKSRNCIYLPILMKHCIDIFYTCNNL